MFRLAVFGLFLIFLGCVNTPKRTSILSELNPEVEAKKFYDEYTNCKQSIKEFCKYRVIEKLAKKIDSEFQYTNDKYRFIQKTMATVDELSGERSSLDVHGWGVDLYHYIKQRKIYIKTATTKWHPTFSGCYRVGDEYGTGCDTMFANDLTYKVVYSHYFPIKKPSELKVGEKVELVFDSLFTPPCKLRKGWSCAKWDIQILTDGHATDSIQYEYDGNSTISFTLPKGSFVGKRQLTEDGVTYGMLYGELWVKFTIDKIVYYFVWPIVD